MRNTILLCIAGTAGIIALGISFYRLSSFVALKKTHYYVFGLVLLIMIVSTFFYFKRLIDELKGIPAADEMTVAISRKAASDSFPYSLSMWIAILIIDMSSNESIMSVCFGIIGMGLIYGGFWLYYNRKGICYD
jgi:hypothetical protein